MYMYLILTAYFADDVTNVSHDKLEKNYLCFETTKEVVTLASSPNARTLGDFQVLLNQPPIEEADCVRCLFFRKSFFLVGQLHCANNQ